MRPRRGFILNVLRLRCRGLVYVYAWVPRQHSSSYWPRRISDAAESDAISVQPIQFIREESFFLFNYLLFNCLFDLPHSALQLRGMLEGTSEGQQGAGHRSVESILWKVTSV